VLYPDEAHCDPERFVSAVGEAAVEAGAEIRLGVEVLGLRRDGPRAMAVDTTVGSVGAGTVVVAAGAWTPGVVRELGIFVPVEGGKGYHVDLEAAEGDPEVPVFLQEARVIATPLPGRLRIAGTLELSGLDLGVDRVRLEAISRASRRVLRIEGRRVVEIWRGLRPCAPDGLPIVGRPPGHESVVLATGHAMMGLTLAPVTGRLVAETVAGETPSQDVSAFRPDRFRRLRLPLAAR
jgi:D-amino-acid dehydrogenase